MDKTAIKNFSVWARNALIRSVTDKCGLLGVRADGIQNPLPQSTKDIQFFDAGTGAPFSISGDEIAKRDALVRAIREKERDTDYKTAYNYIIEQVSYTWFNRLIAIRFMEVNDYLPSRIRVLSSEQEGKLEPDIIASPFDVEFEFTAQERDTILQLKDRGQKEDMDVLFRMLFVKQCDALHEYLPGLFQKVDGQDYTELLLNISFTDREGVVYHLVNDIPEDNFDVSKEGQVEIIGWMYQYYNIEPKDETFALLKKNVKITKERIPAATQLFTPDWIVRYMVENSLGRLWAEGHPNDSLKENWKYYLEEAEQESSVQVQLEQIRAEYRNLNPEDIKVIDPCMGSGHILVYCFDVLMQIYESQGYTQRDAAQSILEHNLYGLDIDDRAAQLAYFAVMMKARQYDRRILTRGIKPHVFAIEESNGLKRSQLQFFGADMAPFEVKKAKLELNALLDTLVDAKEYGSILKVESADWNLLRRFTEGVDVGDQVSMDTMGIEDTQRRLVNLIAIGETMSQRYSVTATNPPYMALSNADSKVNDYVKAHYPECKADMYAVFIERCNQMTAVGGYQAMITQHTWMFLGSYEALRKKLYTRSLLNLLHLGIKAFEEIGNDVVQTCAYIFQNKVCRNRKSKFCRLVEAKDYAKKEQEFFNKSNYSERSVDDFRLIPGDTYAYWVDPAFIENFDSGEKIETYAEFTGSQNITGNNEKYLRNHWEVRAEDIAKSRWVFYAKGGDYRKYYGNLEMVIDWSDSARNFYATNKTSNLLNEHFWFREGITYSAVTSRGTGFRYLPKGCIFDKGGPSIAVNSNLETLLALLNSKVAELYFQVLNPSINLQVKDIKALPIILPATGAAAQIAAENIALAKKDWDSFETSYEFEKHPLLNGANSVESAFREWAKHQEEAFGRVMENEITLNDTFKTLYDLGSIRIDLEDRDIPIRKADLSREIRSLLSYAVGCMFGRYSLDETGLVYAGGEWDTNRYITFTPDVDNCIPITDEDYFSDDIVGQFCGWLEKAFGKELLEENLSFIAKVLGGKGNTSREVIRNYFLNDFFKDHCTMYSVTGSGKRPIYWLYDSGKQNGFKALIYMHRYDTDTTGRIRADYLFKMQRAYENELKRVQDTIDGSSNSREVAQAEKRKEKLTKQLKETRDYDQKLAHLALARIPIDLDDGVKVNYEKIQTAPDGKKLDILAKI